MHWTRAICALACALALAAPAAAQESFHLNHFRPAETMSDGFAVSRPTDQGHMRFGAGLYIDYANDPLVWETDQGDADSEVGALVSSQLTAHLGFNLGIIDRLTVFLGVPIVLLQDGDGDDIAMFTGGVEADGAGLGDISLGARFRILGEPGDSFALGAQATLGLPTSTGDLFLGDDFLMFHPELLAEVRGGPIRVAFNLGARVRDNVDLGTAEVGDDLTFGLGVAFEALDGDSLDLDLHLDFYGATAFNNAFGREESPLELLLGAKIHTSSGISAGIAAGPGLQRGIGSPDLRVIAMAGYTVPEDTEEPEPEVGDRDGDGLLDPDDGCPDEPEDFDQFEDEDGCPDPDNDQDGVLDVNDQCPMEPEDIDQFEDDNGCPDPDNDQDGILDGSDQCPNEPEDMDNLADDDGCPEDDFDGDTVLDPDDSCPRTPGVPNAERRECNGCPELACVTETGVIVILDRVEFATNRDVILERSEPVLNAVYQILQTNDQLNRIRIEGHTDNRGRDSHNDDLSARRARSVMRWLVEHQIDRGRLEAWGCGERLPIEDNRSNRGRQANRRVEFHIIDPAPPAGARNPEGCQAIQLD